MNLYSIPYDLQENLKENIYKEWKHDDPSIKYRIKLGGKKGDKAVAYKGTNGLVKIIYEDEEEKEKEAYYMRKFSKYKGIPRIYYGGDDYNIVEFLKPLPDSIDDIVTLTIVTYKIINLIETLYRNGVYSSHGIGYFTYHNGTDIYFIDNRLWKRLKDNPDGTYYDLKSMLKLLRRLSNDEDFVDELSQYVDRKLRFHLLRGICLKYNRKVICQDLVW